ncbi:hypothetical protein [Noviherbaspirillum massiliense]|uniref:hypothetical protein n=1 Tax=Noviherbaspirillum massiliense TaxID=1465823 RepID=UPI0002E69B75|nr:hypothetical protein [Noviherbaspirillum massiliense]
MTRPENLFEAASYDLIKFRERRMAERRAQARDTPDRRVRQDPNWFMHLPEEGNGAEQAKDAGSAPADAES